MRESELTIRALVLGSVIAAVFTAANIYLGLKVGITIASSIPAAVISMGILRAFNTGSIRENNIVQTVASSGGTLSSIIFVLPGLVMIGWWHSFPFFETFLICSLGGAGYHPATGEVLKRLPGVTIGGPPGRGGRSYALCHSEFLFISAHATHLRSIRPARRRGRRVGCNRNSPT
jgi:hypothetical protein